MKRFDSLDMNKEEFSKVSQAFFIFHGGRKRFLFKITKQNEPTVGENVLIDECMTPFKVLALGDSKVEDSVIYIFTEAMLDEVSTNSN